MLRTPTEILSELSRELGRSIPDLARKSGYGRPQAFYDVMSGKTRNITPKMADNIVRTFPQVNRSTLICGEGELFNTATGSDYGSQSGVGLGAGDSCVQSDSAAGRYSLISRIHHVLLVPISAQGGSLNDFVLSVNGADCEKIVSPICGADFAITVNGDSMAPEFPCGSQVLVKKINALAFIEWGKTYVLDTCNGTVIKKLAPSPSEGCVRCLSVNPLPEFAPFDICMEDVYGFYRVIMCMSLK